MLKRGDENHKDLWERCYDVGQLLQMRGHNVVGVKAHQWPNGDFDYYIVVDHVAWLFNGWCSSQKAETIKDVVVRAEDKVKLIRDKMTWNYRIVRNGGYLSIHEAYYDDSKSEEPNSITLHPVTLGGETKEELLADLEHMKEALHKPILEYGKFEKKE